MSSQWLILFMFISCLQLDVIKSIVELDDIDLINGLDLGNHENEDVPPDTEVQSRYLDCSYYYRLTNKYSGPNRGLDVINDGSNYGLQMATISTNSGQYWRCINLGKNTYKFQTSFLKNEYSLDIINDGAKDKPHMARTNDFTGQRWHLTSHDDGTFKLSNDFSGINMALDVYSNSQLAHMSNSNVGYSGQYWSFTKIQKINTD